MKINLVEFRVAGVFYNCEVEDLQELKEDLKDEDASTTLELEPENEHDKKAIVIISCGFKLGYVPKAFNEMIFNMISGGINVFCEILNVNAIEQKVQARLYLNTYILSTPGEV
jgi:hypothetical protein